MVGLSHYPSTPPLLRLRVKQSLSLPGRLRVAGSTGRLRVANCLSQNSTSRTPGLDAHPSSLILIDPAPLSGSLLIQVRTARYSRPFSVPPTTYDLALSIIMVGDPLFYSEIHTFAYYCHYTFEQGINFEKATPLDLHADPKLLLHRKGDMTIREHHPSL